MITAQELIERLELQPLPLEGGHYRETYRSSLRWVAGSSQAKAVSTAIYYLLTPETFSALHRLPTDEIFHFYLGDPVQMLQLMPDGTARTLLVGSDVLSGQSPQVVVPAGVWQGSRLLPGGAFALMGTTMAPGFDFKDYEAGTADLARRFPAYGNLIEKLLTST